MILVRRDEKLLAKKALTDAAAALEELEKLPEVDRVTFINGKAKIWKGFKAALAAMSYEKCWYTETKDPQSFFDIDHFRPKAEAKRDDGTTDDGYPWLAFDWQNFRFAAGRSNRLSTDEEEELVTGKSSWFPLITGSPKASWADRCEALERPKLLDPTVKADVDLITVAADGSIEPSRLCVGSNVARVQRSIQLYGLNLPKLRAARAQAMRDVEDTYRALMDVLVAANDHPQAADKLPIPVQVSQLRRSTLPDRAFSSATRAQLHLMGAGDLSAGPEDLPTPPDPA